MMELRSCENLACQHEKFLAIALVFCTLHIALSFFVFHPSRWDLKNFHIILAIPRRAEALQRRKSPGLEFGHLPGTAGILAGNINIHTISKKGKNFISP